MLRIQLLVNSNAVSSGLCSDACICLSPFVDFGSFLLLPFLFLFFNIFLCSLLPVKREFHISAGLFNFELAEFSWISCGQAFLRYKRNDKLALCSWILWKHCEGFHIICCLHPLGPSIWIQLSDSPVWLDCMMVYCLVCLFICECNFAFSFILPISIYIFLVSLLHVSWYLFKFIPAISLDLCHDFWSCTFCHGNHIIPVPSPPSRPHPRPLVFRLKRPNKSSHDARCHHLHCFVGFDPSHQCSFRWICRLKSGLLFQFSLFQLRWFWVLFS